MCPNILLMMQNDLDRMQLPDQIRWRIQTAMPFVFPSLRFSVSCQPPSVPPPALASLQPSISLKSGSHPGGSSTYQRNKTVSSSRATSNGSGKATKPDKEIDPWTLLEDGAGSGPSSINAGSMGGNDHVNLTASSWLKGSVRVRRVDLTYIGAMDDDS